ncbi:MAG: hypothetical protein OXI91_13545 [Chloroflexota bacterium]|nr:hypothetical protein [Chloroflexota bacterium]
MNLATIASQLVDTSVLVWMADSALRSRIMPSATAHSLSVQSWRPPIPAQMLGSGVRRVIGVAVGAGVAPVKGVDVGLGVGPVKGVDVDVGIGVAVGAGVGPVKGVDVDVGIGVARVKGVGVPLGRGGVRAPEVCPSDDSGRSSDERPAACPPQHTMEPSVFNPHVCDKPALTDSNSPSGGVTRP